VLSERILAVFAMSVALPLPVSWAAEGGNVSAVPNDVRPRDFSWKSLREPETLFWPATIWWWNGKLDPAVLCGQLADMTAHDVRNALIFPLSNDHRPGDYHMDPDYLTPAFFSRVQIAVGEAARLGMNCWLYDEGAWPAGSVLRHNPHYPMHHATCQLVRRNGTWTQIRNPSAYTNADFLSPQTTAVFIATTHQPFADAVAPHLGSTIKFMFTDEPAYQYVDLGHSIPWTPGGDTLFERRFGYNVLADNKLDAFAVTDVSRLTPAQKKVRVDVFDFLSGQYRDAYFLSKRDWCRRHGIVHCGHLGGEDESLSPVIHGYGSAMRQLRAMDMPGVDAIWRQIFPGKRCETDFPKFASSAAHQNGTALAFTESFAVYGSGLTPAQMKWVADYQFVRGITVYLGSNYPITTRDNAMTGERPRFCPVEPMWDYLTDFHRYAARLSYVLACGQPAIETALYYPVRDIWANGTSSDPALRGFNALAQALIERQCDYDLVDDDVLSDPATRFADGRLAIGPMRYRTIVVGPTRWIAEPSRKRLDEFKAAGGQVVCIDILGQIGAAVPGIAPTVRLDPPSSDIRVLMRRWPGGGAVLLFNEGMNTYTGCASTPLDGRLCEVDPSTGVFRTMENLPSPAGTRGSAAVDTTGSKGRAQLIGLSLVAGQSMLLISAVQDPPTNFAPPTGLKFAQSLELADGWAARVDRQYVVGEHDFEVHPVDNSQFKPAALGRWAKALGLGEDFSGHVTYRRTVSVPELLREGRLLLDLGGLEYAARVSVDGREVGRVLWGPWRIELPPMEGRAGFALEIQVANTLANEITSQRVRNDWSKRKGPGWPSPYHARQIQFEMDSRGGGLLGPVRLHLMRP
jgi:hypothetical protein